MPESQWPLPDFSLAIPARRTRRWPVGWRQWPAVEACALGSCPESGPGRGGLAGIGGGLQLSRGAFALFSSSVRPLFTSASVSAFSLVAAVARNNAFPAPRGRNEEKGSYSGVRDVLVWSPGERGPGALGLAEDEKSARLPCWAGLRRATKMPGRQIQEGVSSHLLVGVRFGRRAIFPSESSVCV